MKSDIKKSIYLLIGYPKTGTTFLHFKIFKNLKDVHYNRDPFFYEIFSKIYSSDPSKEEIDEFQRKLSSKITCNKTLISHESIVVGGNLFKKTKNREKILKELNEIFSLDFNVKIILGVRECESILKSVYKQYLHEGGVLKQKKFMDDLFTNKEDYDYNKCIQSVKQIFGDKNVFIYKYEEFVKNKHSIIKNLLNFMGEKKVPKFKDSYYNKSYSTWQIIIARFFNRFFKTYHNPKGILPRRWHKRFRWGLQTGRWPRFKRFLQNRISKK